MSGQDLVPKGPVRSLKLNVGSDLDISHLPKETQDELQKYAAMRQIDLAANRQQLATDIDATSAQIGNMAQVTSRMSASGDAVTIRQTIDNTAGRTEVLMGNTKEAQSGKVGAEGQIWPYLAGGAVLLMIVASIVASSS